MHTYRNIKNSKNENLQALNCDQSVCSEPQLSAEQADKAENDAMLDMLGISREYYYQVSKFDRLA